MARRRRDADNLALKGDQGPRWIVMSTMDGRRVSSRKLEPQKDLRGLLIAERHEYQSRGYTAEPLFGHSAGFYVNKGGVRYEVSIVCVDPDGPPDSRWPVSSR
jgi:hypothetical protein